jgi:small-conductance mechanosensitive channel
MAEVPGGVAEFEPFIRYHTFADSSINFTVILRAKEFVDQYLVKHEFIKRLHVRFSQEGIVIPFPIRTIVQRDDPTSPDREP